MKGHLRERVDQTLRLLELTNMPPTIFSHGGALCRLYDNKLQDFNLDILRDALTRRGDFFIKQGEKLRIINPPDDVMRSILCNGAYLFPPVDGVFSWPILSPSGNLCVAPGYDSHTRLIYVTSAGFKLPVVPELPGGEQLARAVSILRETFINFPFAEEASFANTIGAALTIALRPAINGRVLMFVVDSPVRGTGKTLLAQAVNLCVTGELVGLTPDCKDDAEWSKRLTTIASEGAPVALIDDIKNSLKSAVLAMFVTAPVWKDRLLKTNSAPSYRNNCVVLVTGNNVELNADFERRVCLIRLDARAFRPYERDASAFTHPDLLRWVGESRPDLLAAIFTMARAWFAAGSPSPKKLKPLGGFEEHMRVIGGILEFAGIDGFMGNAGTVRERSGEENADLIEFLANLDMHYQGKPFTVAELLDGTDSRDGDLDWELVAPPSIPRDARRLGKLFSKFSGRPLRDDNLRVECCEGKQHNKAVWRVVHDGGEG